MATIKINSSIFPLFYEELITKAAKLANSTDLVATPKENFSFWLLPLKTDENTSIIKKIFGDKYAETYFRDRISKHKKALENYGNNAALFEQVHIITPALNFMGYKVPKHLEIKDKQLEARFLYQRFLEKGFPDFLASNKDALMVYDWGNNKFINTDHPVRPRAKKDVYKFMIVPGKRRFEDAMDLEAIRKLGLKFFSHINNLEFLSAFELLTPEAREELFDSHLHYFSDFFYPTKLMEGISTVDARTSVNDDLTGSGYAKVFLTEQREIITKPWNPLLEFNLGSVDQFFDYINEVNRVLAQSNLPKETYDNLPIDFYVSGDLASKLSKHLQTNIKAVLKMFPKTGMMAFNRLYHIKYVYYDNIWRIDDIQTVHTEDSITCHKPYRSFSKSDSYKFSSLNFRPFNRDGF